jgi:hypothetical protein
MTGLPGISAAVLSLALVAWSPVGAGAQTVGEVNWHRGTTLAGFIGVASPPSETGAAAGLALGWELLPHLVIEGRGVWLDAGADAGSFAAALGARVPLRPARPIVPFLSSGVGFYRAWFDRPRNGMPEFYRQRLDSATDLVSATFDDFAVTIGGGADVFLKEHLALRPELTVMLVIAGSNARPVPIYGVHLAYHFEDHPITPARRNRFPGAVQ